jgi:hypothetical protein
MDMENADLVFQAETTGHGRIEQERVERSKTTETNILVVGRPMVLLTLMQINCYYY